MSVIEETSNDEVLRVHCVGVFKWVLEDWMLNREKQEAMSNSKTPKEK